MLMRVCVTDIETGEVLFLRQFSPRQRVRGLTLGSAPDDDIQVTTLGQQKLRVILRGRKSVLLTQGFQPTATTMQASDREFELRVTSGSMLEIDGQRVEFAAAGGAGKSVAGTTATPAAVPSTEDREAKTCFARLFLTLVHELARMERGAEAMMTEFDMPAGDSGSEPFEKWVFSRLDDAASGRVDVDELIRDVRRRFSRLSTLQLVSFETLQDCVDRVRMELDPTTIASKATPVQRFFSNLGAWRRYLERYNDAFASSQRFYNEYVYPTARTNWLRHLESRKSVAVLKSAS
ncbi:MAG: hypothetical protein KDB68_05835 [Planctomycetes bacterium]|nr:hypothetical protein [Planctomycetota bacterium]MCA8946797.1 hypothetical protein [Planctomycetota bacterium]